MTDQTKSDSRSLPDVPARGRVPVPVVPAGPVIGWTRSWQLDRKPTLSVVVRARCKLVVGKPAVPLEEPPLPAEKALPEDGEYLASLDDGLAAVSDFAVYKPRADVTVAGLAYPEGRHPSSVRLCFGSGDEAIDKTIAVFGSRRFDRAGVPRSLAPLDTVAMEYAQAFGGPDYEANPVGVGYRDGQLPSFENPKALITKKGDAAEPACLAPTLPTWAPRCAMVGTYDAEWLQTRWPYHPADFDWHFYQDAPADQQLPYPRGDERFSIHGMRPGGAALHGQLPGIELHGWTQGVGPAGGTFAPMRLELDTVHFDTEALTVDLSWRGLLQVDDDRASNVAAIFVSVEPLAKASSRATAAPARLDIDAARAAFWAEYPRYLDPTLDDEEPFVDEQIGSRPTAGGSGDASDDSEGSPAPSVGDGASDESSPTPSVGDGAGEKDSPTKGAEQRAVVLDCMARKLPLGDLDLAGADLSDLDLSGQSLSGANLTAANLRGAVLDGAVLDGAVLDGADLSDARARMASFIDTSLHAAVLDRIDLTGAILDRADATEARLREAILTDASGEALLLESADISGVQAAGAQLPAVDLSNATLDQADFRGARLVEARLYEAKGVSVRFERADLTDARADGCQLEKANLDEVSAPGSVWDDAKLEGCSLQAADLSRANFIGVQACDSLWSQSRMREAVFRDADLQRASLLKADLMEASLQSVNAAHADFRGANLYGAETWLGDFEGAKFELAIVAGTKLVEKT